MCSSHEECLTPGVNAQHRSHEVSVPETDFGKHHPWGHLGIPTSIFLLLSVLIEMMILVWIAHLKPAAVTPILYLILRKKYWAQITIFHQHSISFSSVLKHTKKVFPSRIQTIPSTIQHFAFNSGYTYVKERHTAIQTRREGGSED